jgi:hypothetical protein
MLKNMGRPSAFFNALEKSTGFTIAAAMLNKARECFDKAVIKTRNEVGGVVL